MFYIEWLQYVEDNWVYDTANCFLIGCRLLGSTSLPHSRRGLVQPAIYIEHQVADLPGCICVSFIMSLKWRIPFPRCILPYISAWALVAPPFLGQVGRVPTEN